MRLTKLTGLLFLAVLAASSLAAADAPAPPDAELLTYSWKVHGVLAWFAGLKFPTEGKGELRTYAEPGGDAVNSRLFITGPDQNQGYYLYESQMARNGERTMVSYHGYAWGTKERKEKTLFDYDKGLARMHKETSGNSPEYRVKKLPANALRDFLTGIFYLRQNASLITKTLSSEVYSDGKMYPVVFRPLGPVTLDSRNGKVTTERFLITGAPGAPERWPGGVKVWLSDDGRHVPVRIELQESFAVLRLDLQSAEGTAVASR